MVNLQQYGAERVRGSIDVPLYRSMLADTRSLIDEAAALAELGPTQVGTWERVSERLVEDGLIHPHGPEDIIPHSKEQRAALLLALREYEDLIEQALETAHGPST